MSDENRTMRIAYGIYFFIAIAFVTLRMLSSFGLLSFLGENGNYIFTLVVQVVLLLGSSVFLFSAFSRRRLSDTLDIYNVKKLSGKVTIYCFLIGILVFFVNVFVSSFFSSILSSFGYDPNRTSTVMTEYPVWLLFVNIFFTAVLPAICEELTHRGMILTSISSFGVRKAIIISSILFGLLHLNIEQFFYATLIGVLLGYVTLVTRSIFPAMIIHFVNNALSVILTFSSVRGLPFAGMFAELSRLLETNIVIGLILIVLIVLLLVWLIGQLLIRMFLYNAKDRWERSKNILIKELKRNKFFADRERERRRIEDPDNKQEVITEIDASGVDFQNIVREQWEDGIFYHESGEHKPDNLPPEFVKFMQEFSRKKPKEDTLSKILLISTIVMMSAITIFTFVWGVI